MINVFKKLKKFALEEQSYIKKSVIASFFGAIFNAFQFAAIYFAIFGIINKNISYKTIGICSAFLLVSVLGVIITKKDSMLKQTHAGYFMAAHKRIHLGEKIKRVPMGFFSEMSLGNLTTIATTNLDNVETWVPNLYIMVLGGLINAFVFILSLFTLSYKVGIVAVLGSIIFLIITALMQKKSSRNADKIHKVQRNLTKEVLATLQGIQVIKSYNLVGKNNEKLDKAFEDTKEAALGMEKNIVPYSILQGIVIAITIVSMILLAIKSYFDGELLLANAIMILVASFVIFDGLIASGSAIAMLRIVENAINSYDYVDKLQDTQDGNDNKRIKNYDIEFKNVAFSYDQRSILKDVSCKIKENTMTAIVGPSGSGKTTFCNLIARFWDVKSGEILIGGKNIKDYKIENLMNSISMVFQDVYLFEDTIENNIKFGKQDASHDEVVEAAKKARCHEFIEALPEGYNTIIGEGGASLSGGEKQRISIARAMLKDADIIIFDEATANIDPENEDKLKEAIESLTKNKTVIMIAHRLKTIRNADQILVLNKGNIEERGDHKTLMEYGGLYKDLIEAKNISESWKLIN
ncbi:transporter [Streptococcus agalactiae]|uniref:ABC transporter ATP-binding protein n=1 Tax=Streptococcus agalactiae TaxID=1311 RepID=UPI000E071EF3|nr:ABC transporter ATP-binding protein [Streptococcus agalactiae]SUN10199.1 transporter [Streptococcus agalactiae]